MTDELKSDVDHHQMLLTSHIEKIAKIEEHVKDSKAFIDSVTSQLSIIVSDLYKINSIQDSISVLSKALLDLEREFNLFKNKYVSENKRFEERIDMRFAESLSNNSALKNQIDELIIKLSDECEKSCNTISMLAYQETSLQNLLLIFEKNIKKWTDERILQINIPDFESIIKSLVQDVDKKLESIGIECKNAVLKAGNIANQIPMIEKKIENLYLNLQKIDISCKK